MAWSRIQGPSGANWRGEITTTTNPLVITGAATTTGSTLILGVAYNSAGSSISTVVDDAGNTWSFIARHLQSGTATPIEFWYCTPNQHTSSATSITITFSGTLRASAMMEEWSGGDSTGTLDSVGTNPVKANVNGAQTISPSITPSDDGSLVVSITNNNQTATPPTLTWTGASAVASIGAQSGRALTMAYQVVSPAAAQTITWDKGTATGAMAGMTLALKAGAAAAPTVKTLSALGVG